MDQELGQLSASSRRDDASRLTAGELENYLRQIPDWDLVDEDGVKKLRRSFEFKNFVEALDFTNEVGAVAEAERHHPIITLTWGKATVTWYSHQIKGLHKNDFIMAAKTDDRYPVG